MTESPRRRSEWDADGTISTHLARKTALDLLAQAGWSKDSRGRWVHEVSGIWAWETDEALTIILEQQAIAGS